MVCPRASARTLSMYGLTCSLREGCTYLQQIPSGRMLQALTFLTMRGARTGIECWCCDARVITPCRLRVRPRRNFWPPGTHHLTIRCSRTSQIRNASQASCSIAAPPSSAGTSSTLRGSGCRRRQSLLLRPAVTTQVDANPSQADHNTTRHIQAAAALLQNH